MIIILDYKHVCACLCHVNHLILDLPGPVSKESLGQGVVLWADLLVEHDVSQDSFYAYNLEKHQRLLKYIIKSLKLD